MKYVFTGKNMNVSEDLKEKTRAKLNRVEKLFPWRNEAEAHVTFSTVRHMIKTEVTIPLLKRTLRAEIMAEDALSALDEIVDILEKQTIKFKSRLRDRHRKSAATQEEVRFIEEPAADTEPDGEIVITKTKRFALRPMDAQEAIMEMELLGHSFFVFRNGKTDETNVVYKRNDGEYGLIEPLF